ncbi:MaoC family dehydratase [Rhodococcus qingshengii]|uniref:MaoC family dehydratase n=1 Tax=Rhodococcus qingshengii TaxID=334542 RepID=UPI001ABF5050|nr:MaoC family dehydratase [Rhodococcus qingshengii]
MQAFHGIDELKNAAGQNLGSSEWHTISQEQVNRFADATGDHQWIHIDEEKAAAGPFGGTIAHGFLTLSLLPMLTSEIYHLKGVKMGINYGCNKVRFPSALRVSTRVRANAELLGVDANSLGFLVTTRVTIEAEGGDKPVCVAETLAVVVP